MTTQPEALRLADWIESDMSCHGDAEIAAELRRLHAENALLHERHHFDNGFLKELLDALKQIADIQNKDWGGDWDEIEEARLIACAAIAKAEGQA